MYRPYLNQLKELFDDMDVAYDRVADNYGFRCTGCVDSCCRSRFYHHTLLEYLVIREGLIELPSGPKNDITAEAERLKTGDHEDRPMCPVNLGGRCQLYRYRPMICRLHGISHELRKPGQVSIQSPGCEAFTIKAQGKPYFKFDRTPFYSQMARIEAGLRQASGITHKFKKTVAQMIVAFNESSSDQGWKER